MPRLRRVRSALIVILAGGVLGAIATLPGNLRPALGQTAGPPPTFITIVNPPPPPVVLVPPPPAAIVVAAPPPPAIVVAAPPPPAIVVAAPPPSAVVVEAPPPPPAVVIAPPPPVEVRQPTVQGPAPAPKPAIQPAPRPALPRLPNTGTGGMLDRGSDEPAPAVFSLLASGIVGVAVAAIAYRELRRRI